MNKSENINELAKALAQVQKVLKPAKFDATNPFFKSKYASLGSVIEVAKVLSEHGLSYSQMPISDGWQIGIENILMHESGQWISQAVLIPMDIESKNPTQEAGKIITYARRYGLASMLGIYSDEDTDGNSGSQKIDTNVEDIIKDHWNPLVERAKKVGIEVSPLPDKINEPMLRTLWAELKKRVEEAE
jgi:hypothetical protein